MTTIREWLTAQEIADAGLPGLPGSKRGINAVAVQAGWRQDAAHCRQRAGRDGGGGLEYHVRLLPTAARVAWYARGLGAETTPASDGDAQGDTEGAAPVRDTARLERDARLHLVGQADLYRKKTGVAVGAADRMISQLYNAGKLTVPAWVSDTVPEISPRSLARWRSARRAGETDRLAVDRGAARRGTGLLDVAEGGRVATFILALIAHQPHLSAAEVRRQCRAEFGDAVEVRPGEPRVAFPPVRTFQHHLKGLKQTRNVALMALTNPDRYRSTMAPAGVGSLRHVTRPNQLWQIDASPVDALCTDGRHSVYACIDIATRRTVLYVSRTPRAAAVALLIRKAVMVWGAPEAIKTDNGSDFTARDTERLFASLGIEMILSAPYRPQEKGHVERVIRTFQHGFAVLLPGYTGHSVADRKAIEDRKSFADRLGADTADLFAVSLDGATLQRHADEWIDLAYSHAPHAGLGGRTPAQAAAASAEPMRAVDPRALDMLLMPLAGGDGTRTVTKLGIRIDHHHYVVAGCLPGDRVMVRMDPHDVGRAHAFDAETGAWRGEAVCPELAGLHPATVLQAKREAQNEILARTTAEARAEIKRLTKGRPLIERAMEVARRDVPNVVALPRRATPHETPAIAAALDAAGARPAADLTDPRTLEAQRRIIARMADEDAAAALDRAEAAAAAPAPVRPAPQARVVAMPETPLDRYRRAARIAAAPEAAGPDDLMWLARYQQTAEYRGQRRLHETDPSYLTV